MNNITWVKWLVLIKFGLFDRLKERYVCVFKPSGSQELRAFDASISLSLSPSWIVLIKLGMCVYSNLVVLKS
jgi:hypothetical protein